MVLMHPWKKKLLAMKRGAAERTVTHEAPKTMTETVELASRLKPEACVTHGWQFLMTRYQRGGEIRWHLSAMLVPKGRSSTEADWEFLGRAVQVLGAPEEPLITPADPNAPLHWKWTEQPAAPPPAPEAA